MIRGWFEVKTIEGRVWALPDLSGDGAYRTEVLLAEVVRDIGRVYPSGAQHVTVTWYEVKETKR